MSIVVLTSLAITTFSQQIGVGGFGTTPPVNCIRLELLITAFDERWLIWFRLTTLYTYDVCSRQKYMYIYRERTSRCCCNNNINNYKIEIAKRVISFCFLVELWFDFLCMHSITFIIFLPFPLSLSLALSLSLTWLNTEALAMGGDAHDLHFRQTNEGTLQKFLSLLRHFVSLPLPLSLSLALFWTTF